MLKSIKPSFSIFVLILSLQIQAPALQCRELFSNQQKKTKPVQIEKSNALKDFDQNNVFSFSEIKSFLKDQFDQKKQIKPTDLKDHVSRLALMEILAERSGWDILNLRNEVLNGPTLKQVRIMETLQNLSFDRGLPVYQLETIISQLYRLSNSNPKNIDFSVSKIEQKIDNERIELSFLKQSFTEALTDLGFIRSPEGLEKLKAFRKRYANYEKILISTALNAFSIAYSSMPAHLPQIKFDQQRRQTIPKFIIEKIKECGIECARSDLAQLFPSKPHFEFGWTKLRQAYRIAMITYTTFMTVQFYPLARLSLEALFVTEQGLSQLQKETFNADRIRDEQFKNWKQAFKEIEGREPNPKIFPQDKAEWDNVWNSLHNAKDEDLKIKYFSNEK